MNPEVRMSPDGEWVAIRSENAEDAWNAWAIMHRRNGGHFGSASEVQAWPLLVREAV